MTVAIVLMSVSTPAHARFFDVAEDHPYFDAIDFLTRESIVTGYENRSFRPEVYINRAEFTKILVSMLFPKEYIDTCIEDVAEITSAQNSESLQVFPSFSFPDVPWDAWFAPYVCTAWVNGIASGYPDGRFRPEEGVKFVEAAKMLSVGFGLTGVDLPNFGSTNVEWYRPYVEFLAAKNAIPYSITELGNPINRGEMAELIYRLKDAPYVPSPVEKKSKTADDVYYPVETTEYRNEDYTFAFGYNTIWPKPTFLPRGTYDGRSPYIRSEWTLYFGPKQTDNCIGSQECVARDMWVDGYHVDDSSAILDAVMNDEFFINVTEQTIINGLPALVLLEEVGDCIDKRAFLFGKKWIYTINFRCGGEDQKLFDYFDQMLPSFKEIAERPPEHRK